MLDQSIIETIRDSSEVPTVHVFDEGLTSGEVYDITQTEDSIKDGDVLVVPAEQIVGILMQAWPCAVLTHPDTGDAGSFHEVESPGVFWETDGGKYRLSYLLAKRVHIDRI